MGSQADPDGKIDRFCFDGQPGRSRRSRWQTDTCQPFLGPGVTGSPTFLGNDQKNYWAQIVGVTLRYKFE